jgi:probable F420-dependent oxidoreductase
MRFSVSLPYPGDEATGAEADDMVELAQAAERAGLDACAVTDHPFPAVGPGEAGHQALDPFVLLGHLSAATEQLVMHFNLVVLPYRNPFLVARMISTLDLLSHGRVIVGVGAGYMRKEFDALGAPFGRRGTRLEEDVAAMKAVWTGEPAFLRSDRYAAEGNVMRPPPLTSPHPPLWRGGNSQRAIESAARAFDGWTPFEGSEKNAKDTYTAPMSLETLPDAISSLRAEERRLGREKPLDVCLVRPGTRWMKERSNAIQELQQLDSLGVNWIAAALYGHTTSQRIESAEALAELASAAGVR